MTRNGAQTEIRRLATDRDKIRFTDHALKRDPGKGKHPISERQTVNCLLSCILHEDPTPDLKLANGWKFTAQRTQEETTTTVAGVLVVDTRILVITGYEERRFRRRGEPGKADAQDSEEDDHDGDEGEDSNDD